MRERYINPFTDFGFKKLFGEEANTDLLIDFLNTLLPDAGTITSLTFLKSEHLGTTPADRKAIFDLYCQNQSGEKFIVELQKAKQTYFKDRSLYYASFALQEQALVGDWNFRLQKVYAIAIMDFIFDESAGQHAKYRHDIQLMDTETHRIFYDKLHFVFLEMPKFSKTEAELETHFDKWLYVLKNLARLQDLPARLQEHIFEHIFHVAEIAQYTETERYAYQDSVKYYRDIKNSLDTAHDEGRAEGREEGLVEGEAKGKYRARQEMARTLRESGFAATDIARLTKLSLDEIAQLDREQ